MVTASCCYISTYHMSMAAICVADTRFCILAATSLLLSCLDFRPIYEVVMCGPLQSPLTAAAAAEEPEAPKSSPAMSAMKAFSLASYDSRVLTAVTKNATRPA